jgi:hypothetical protein
MLLPEGKAEMLSKCANPGCPAPFLYLHEGKLFRLDIGTESAAGQTSQKAVRNLEFFWLCGECAAKLTLRYKKGVGVTTVSLPETRGQAASAS